MNPIKKTIAYFSSAQAEMKKVSWPTRQETIRYSALVIGLSLGIAVFFATLDFGLTKLVDVTISARQAAVQQNTPANDIQVTPVTPDLVPTVETTTTAPAAAPIDLKDAKPLETPKL